MTNNDLINELINDGYLKTPRIIEAFLKIDRINFLPPEIKNLAYQNTALPIGWSQTISQPLVVAFMLELLQPQTGEKILDIGFGSGWQAALLAYLVQNKAGQNGKIYAVERIPELYEFGRNNIAKFNFLEEGIVSCFLKDGSKGLSEVASQIGGFDKVIAAASADKIPDEWKKQVKISGRIVAPIKHSIWMLIKINNTKFDKQEYFGFSFVPLVEK